jgi:hypothetical protein
MYSFARKRSQTGSPDGFRPAISAFLFYGSPRAMSVRFFSLFVNAALQMPKIAGKVVI